MSDVNSDLYDGKVSAIILAAGSSSRLGQSKQLVEVDGVSLLLKSTQAALNANYSRVLVVLGANADAHKKVIEHLPVTSIIHADWQMGMGSSLKAGLQYIIDSEHETNAIVVMVCDQPLLSSSHLKRLLETYQNTSKKIVASRYGETIGVPALFDRSMFPEVLKIKDSQGAKVVVANNLHTVATIDWAEGSMDIDTPEDLIKLKSIE